MVIGTVQQLRNRAVTARRLAESLPESDAQRLCAYAEECEFFAGLSEFATCCAVCGQRVTCRGSSVTIAMDKTVEGTSHASIPGRPDRMA